MPHRYARVEKAVDALKAAFGNRIETRISLRGQHAHTMTYLRPELPDAVFKPRSIDEVQQVVRLCAALPFPLIAFGAGSSMEGQVNAPCGGLSLDVTEMNRIVSVNATDLDCVVEPGVTRLQLNDHVRSDGLFFPLDPGADATVGGMASTRASGTNAVRYGTMKQNVLAAKLVLPSGDLADVGSRARKSSAGYDMVSLFVGAEGTLGVFVELALRLYGLPDEIATAVCTFPDVRAATDTVVETLQFGLPVARLELIDQLSVQALNKASRLCMAEVPTLFVEFHGIGNSVKEQMQMFGELAQGHGGKLSTIATHPEDRNAMWKARHELLFALSELRPGAQRVPTDVCVPISQLAECVDETARDMKASGLIAPILGHVGDGNFHVTPLVEPGNAEELDRALAAVDRLNSRALACGGTCTGETGIGQGKRAYLQKEFSQTTLELMRALKQTVDPNDIMNPGKIF